MTKKNFHVNNNVILPYEYDKVEVFIKDYKPSTNINYIIETYLVINLLKKESRFKEFKHLMKQFYVDIFKNLSDSFFEIDYDDVNIMYRNSFWKLLFECNKVNENDEERFSTYVNKYDIQLIHLSCIDEIVKLFPVVVKNNFLDYPQNIEFFINHQSGKYIDSRTGLFIKINLTNEEVNNLARKYCEGDLANPNYLEAIFNYKKTSRYYFEDEVKLSSKRKSESIWKDHFKNHLGVSYSLGVSIAPIENEQLFSYENYGLTSKIVINKNVLDEYHDFSTLLNNYIYFFNFFSYDTGLPWLVLNSDTFNFYELFSLKSNADYSGYDKNLKMSCSLIFHAYFDYLKNNKIDLEEIIEWYFNTYIVEELGIEGFRFNSSNKVSSYYERSKSIISEMDSILNQFELFEKNREIDFELLSIKSKPTSYDNLKSFKKHKFLKLKTNSETSRLMLMLFSDQSHLAYTLSNEEFHPFFRLVEIGVNISDFNDYQQKDIWYLIERNIIEIVDDAIKFKNIREIKILYMLWKTGTFCLFYKLESDLVVAQNLVEKNFCEYTSKVFSEPEINYLSFILDDKKYGNGPKIRNKFVHGKFSNLDEKKYLEYYLELLQIAIFYVIRINDELEYYAGMNNSK
ncbi:hypothetical protein [Streptococcus equinus]|uniref:hypothetical protein n=1 Tax=Streptococcus equinus TaxID=1335 RepID=UPI003BF7B647